MLVGQMASSVAVVSVIGAENSSIDWATRMAATHRLWCTIHGVPRAREPLQRGKPAYAHCCWSVEFLGYEPMLV